MADYPSQGMACQILGVWGWNFTTGGTVEITWKDNGVPLPYTTKVTAANGYYAGSVSALYYLPSGYHTYHQYSATATDEDTGLTVTAAVQC